MANINIRIDEKVKKNAESVFTQLGLTPTTAITLFYNQVIRTNSIPFELALEKPNRKTIKAMREAEELEKNPKKGKPYQTVDSLLEDLLK